MRSVVTSYGDVVDCEDAEQHKIPFLYCSEGGVEYRFSEYKPKHSYDYEKGCPKFCTGIKEEAVKFQGAL